MRSLRVVGKVAVLCCLISLAGCGDGESTESNAKDPADCGLLESGRDIAIDAVVESRKASDPRAAVELVALEGVDIVEVKEVSATETDVVVRIDDVDGTYRTLRDGEQWAAVAGEGCAAAGGGPDFADCHPTDFDPSATGEQLAFCEPS